MKPLLLSCSSPTTTMSSRAESKPTVVLQIRPSSLLKELPQSSPPTACSHHGRQQGVEPDERQLLLDIADDELQGKERNGISPDNTKTATNQQQLYITTSRASLPSPLRTATPPKKERRGARRKEETLRERNERDQREERKGKVRAPHRR